MTHRQPDFTDVYHSVLLAIRPSLSELRPKFYIDAQRMAIEAIPPKVWSIVMETVPESAPVIIFVIF